MQATLTRILVNQCMGFSLWSIGFILLSQSFGMVLCAQGHKMFYFSDSCYALKKYSVLCSILLAVRTWKLNCLTEDEFDTNGLTLNQEDQYFASLRGNMLSTYPLSG